MESAPTPPPPTLTFTNPLDGAQLDDVSGEDVGVTVTADDADGVTWVDLYVNDVLVRRDIVDI